MSLDPTATYDADEDELDLIACCLMGYSALDVDIAPAEFRQPDHELTWQALLHVSSTQRPDPASVRLALGSEGNRLGAWLLEVLARPVAPVNAPAFAERVRQAAQLRGLQQLAISIMQAASSDGADPARINERIREHTDKPLAGPIDTVTVGDLLPDVIDELQQGRPTGLSTPWPDLDRKIHGIAPGRFYIVAARPGVGKSILAQNLAWHWSTRHQQTVLFASLEMEGADIVRRLIAQAANVDLTALQNGNMTPADWARTTRASPQLMGSTIHLCAKTDQTVDTIARIARDLHRRGNLGLIVVDYLQLVSARDRRMPREQQVADVSRGLKKLALDLGVPVVAMSQVNRDSVRGKDGTIRPPGLADLRESGSLEQDADVVLMIHIPDPDAEWEADLIVAKARNGTRGTVPIYLETKYATILNERQSA